LPLPDFVSALRKDQIGLVIRQNEQGLVYSLTFVAHNTRSVVNGSDLGKGYSAAGILNRFHRPGSQENSQDISKNTPEMAKNKPEPSTSGSLPSLDIPLLPRVPDFNIKSPQVLAELLKYQPGFGMDPKELREDKRQQRRNLR
jgi:hypothetical protein